MESVKRDLEGVTEVATVGSYYLYGWENKWKKWRWLQPRTLEEQGHCATVASDGDLNKLVLYILEKLHTGLSCRLLEWRSSGVRRTGTAGRQEAHRKRKSLSQLLAESNSFQECGSGTPSSSTTKQKRRLGLEPEQITTVSFYLNSCSTLSKHTG